ncbi:hypothetical protein IV77_GL000872 [Olsenella uli DSM 7084]|uniref:hypothetical protein n=1 Tax=Olsenella uli TaxID=133926 RepID=UPI000307A20E|nr:hypothetical protein [Olsenella uli]KRO13421.1 hypothetical protein IV77_GL000872 [Olsenella uli DSM 7084]MBS6417391.1 hypothetical protein [Olsenella uli]
MASSAIGDGVFPSFMLSAKAYSRNGKNPDFARQSDIDKVRHPKLIIELAR